MYVYDMVLYMNYYIVRILLICLVFSFFLGEVIFYCSCIRDIILYDIVIFKCFDVE